MKKTLLVDLDYVICYPGFLKILNDFLGTSYVEEDFTDYIIDPIIGSQEKINEFYDYYIARDGYKDAVLFPDVKEVLKKLDKYYNIHICSACVMFGAEKKSAKLFKDKFEYLIREFPFLDPENIIFTNSKNLFQADVQIDDRIQNLKGNIKTKILFDAYHNREISDEELKENNTIRVKSWKDIEKILLTDKEL